MIFPSSPLHFYNLRRVGVKWFLHHVPLVKSENLFQISLFIHVMLSQRFRYAENLYISLSKGKKKKKKPQAKGKLEPYTALKDLYLLS